MNGKARVIESVLRGRFRICAVTVVDKQFIPPLFRIKFARIGDINIQKAVAIDIRKTDSG